MISLIGENRNYILKDPALFITYTIPFTPDLYRKEI
jgi:hypothetical protein